MTSNSIRAIRLSKYLQLLISPFLSSIKKRIRLGGLSTTILIDEVDILID